MHEKVIEQIANIATDWMILTFVHLNGKHFAIKILQHICQIE